MKMIVDGRARAELRKARRWYDKRQHGLGLQLLDDVRAALSRIERDPSIGPRYHNSPYRFYRTARFPFVIYYLELTDHLFVVAIAHERRRQGYWKRRKRL